MKTVTNLQEAAQAGIQWAKDRKATGSDWKAFLLEDAIAVCEGSEDLRVDLAHAVCEAGSTHFRFLTISKQ